MTTENTNTDRATRMRTLLVKEFSPSILMIRDESKRHQKHAHARSEEKDLRGPQQVGETHYAIEMVSDRFNSLRPLARHRLVNDTLSDEFKTGLHALSLTLEGSTTV